jgi:hypothetical protein
VGPGTGLDGMYAIAGTITVAAIMFTRLLRYMREDDENEDDDEDE